MFYMPKLVMDIVWNDCFCTGWMLHKQQLTFKDKLLAWSDYSSHIKDKLLDQKLIIDLLPKSFSWTCVMHGISGLWEIDIMALNLVSSSSLQGRLNCFTHALAFKIAWVSKEAPTQLNHIGMWYLSKDGLPIGRRQTLSTMAVENGTE